MIVIKSLETIFANPTPESKVTFEVTEQIGPMTRVVDTISMPLQGNQSITDPNLIETISVALVGTQWEQYL